jgi:hypothetical protein
VSDAPRAIPVAIHRYRVLFGDGATVDYLAHSHNSDVRALMLDEHYGKRAKGNHDDRIEGIVDLGVAYQHTPAEPTTARRTRQSR